MLLLPNIGFANSELNEDVKELFKVPLTEILKRQNITVTSVSKKAESLSDAAASIYVITANDIRRSGVTSIPEALRLAPGMQVARVDSNKWAISARGLNAQLANKLLVLIDGRDVYTPLFSGVNWDVQDLMLEDIDRIEVIRGSGATLWGANAVNGVVNIITKNAKATPAKLVTTTIGNLDRSIGARKGGKVGKDFYYRIYGKGFKYGDTNSVDGEDAYDSWRQIRTGFRSDWDYSKKDKITMQGDMYKGGEDRRTLLPVPTPELIETVEEEQRRAGANLLLKWNRKISKVSQTSLQMYFDKVIRNNTTLKQNRNTYDIDFQHTWNFNDRNELIWGVGYRYIEDRLSGTDYIEFDPSERSYDLISAFIQNKYSLIPEKLFITLGSKFEYNDFTDFEVQPNIRALWKVNDKNTLWTAVSRSVRTPSRAEDDIELIISHVPGTGGAVLASQRGSRVFDSENLMSYELGYRTIPRDNMFVDITMFINKYSDARTFEVGSLELNGSWPVIPFTPDNQGDISTHGIELSAEWKVRPDWQLIAAYTYIEIDVDLDSGSTDSILLEEENKTPHNQVSLRSRYDVNEKVELDASVFYVDELEDTSIDSYVRFDTRVSWTPYKDTELSVVGQNLFDDKHQEFTDPVHGIASNIPTTYYLKFTKRF